MSDVQIKPVETRRQQRAFIQLAWDLYRNDPNWIPPLRQRKKELLGDALGETTKRRDLVKQQNEKKNYSDLCGIHFMNSPI